MLEILTKKDKEAYELQIAELKKNITQITDNNLKNINEITELNKKITALNSINRDLNYRNDKLVESISNLTELLNEKYESLVFGLVAIQTSPYDSPIVYQRGKKITQDDGHYNDISIYFRNDGLPSVQIEGV